MCFAKVMNYFWMLLCLDVQLHLFEKDLIWERGGTPAVSTSGNLKLGTLKLRHAEGGYFAKQGVNVVRGKFKIQIQILLVLWISG